MRISDDVISRHCKSEKRHAKRRLNDSEGLRIELTKSDTKSFNLEQENVDTKTETSYDLKLLKGFLKK